MAQEQSPGETHISFAAGPVAGAGVGSGDASVTLPTLRPLGVGASLPRPRIRFGPIAGRLGLGALVLATLVVVAAAASGPSVLVPRSTITFPGWESGPLHSLIPRLITNPDTLGIAFSGVLVAMIVAYAVVLGAVRMLSMRAIVICVVMLHVIILMSPPLQLNDLFNYLGYARLGGLHHMNPYTHVIKQELFDPVFRFTTWHSLRSPYGSLFTALTYPLAFVSLPFAYWTLKVATVLLSLAFLALVWHCARQLGRDPRFAVVFVALNPIYLIYAVGGFHNDFFMLAPAMGAIALMLARRDRAAGAVLVLAIAVKFTAVLLLPFLLIAVRTNPRRARMLIGAVLAAIPMIVLSVALFGLSVPNLSDQSSLLTQFSVPNVVGLAIGIGGATPDLLRIASIGVVLVVAYEVSRRSDWVAGAGWSTLALIASLAWLVPWYVIWLLPLAALGTSLRLRRAALVLSVFLVLTFMPATTQYMVRHRISLLTSPAGQASLARQQKLST
jgi:hypothetical protein